MGGRAVTRLLDTSVLENLVLHLIQNTQGKQQLRIYFIHER